MKSAYIWNCFIWAKTKTHKFLSRINNQLHVYVIIILTGFHIGQYLYILALSSPSPQTLDLTHFVIVINSGVCNTPTAGEHVQIEVIQTTRDYTGQFSLYIHIHTKRNYRTAGIFQRFWFGKCTGNRQIKTSPILSVALSRNAHTFVSPNLKFAKMFWWVIRQN